MRRSLFALALISLVAILPSQAEAQPGVAVTVKTDQKIYAVGQPVTFTVRATNKSKQPVTLTFPSSQGYDFTVTTAPRGSLVWRWADGKNFLQNVTTRTLGPGETLTFTEMWNQQSPYVGGGQVPPGKYAVTGTLTALPPLQSRPMTFEIR